MNAHSNDLEIEIKNTFRNTEALDYKYQGMQQEYCNTVQVEHWTTLMKIKIYVQNIYTSGTYLAY